MHTITFHAEDKVGNIEPLKTFQVALLDTPPPAPADVAAKAASSTSILLTWSPVAYQGLKGYRIYRIVGGNEQEVGNVGATASPQFTVPGLVTGQVEVFVIRSEDSLGRVSTPSSQVTATPSVLKPVITRPQEGDTVGTFAIVINGTAEPGAEILCAVGAGGAYEVLATADSAGSFNGTKTLSPEGWNALYFKAGKSGSVSEARSVNVRVNLKPSVPTGLTAKALDTRIRLVWNREFLEPDIVKYRIYRDGNLVPLMEVQDPGVGGTVEMTDWALTNGRTYSYRVEAVDGGGMSSGLSEPVLVKPKAGLEWGE
jgi:hypothetical protein